MQGYVDALAPDARGQAIHRVIRKLNRLAGRAECHRGQHRAENFLLRNDRRGMHITKQRRRIVESTRWQFDLRLPAGCAFRDSLVNQPLDAVKLHSCHDRANVDGLIERRTGAQGAHAAAHFRDERFGDALLHQQA